MHWVLAALVVVGALAGLPPLLAARGRADAQLATLAEAVAARFGLELSGGGSSWRLDGPDGSSVELTLGGDAGGDAVATLQAELGPAVPADARLVPEGLFSGEDPEVGDPAFDSAVHLTGPLDWLSAALCADTRAALLRLHEAGPLQLRRGRLQAQRALRWGDEQALRSWVQDGRRVLRGIAVGDVVEALQRRSRTDPVLGVRFLAGQRLLQLHGESEPARAFAVGVLAEGPVGLRLEAAELLGDAATLAAVAVDVQESPERRARAVAGATKSGAGAEGVDWLASALRDDDPGVQAAAFVAAVAVGRADLLLARGQAPLPPSSGGAFARALEACGGDAEPLLRRLLQEADARGAVEAAGVLGRIGGLGSVPALRRLAERSTLRPALARACAEALAAIEERRGGLGAGGLSLAESHAGGLSVAQGGGLAVTDPGTKARG